MSYYSPIFSEQQKAYDFKPVENAHRSHRQQYYRGTIGSVSATIGQGGFTALLDDGVTDCACFRKGRKTDGPILSERQCSALYPNARAFWD